MHMLGHIGWDSMLSPVCGRAFTLVCVYFGHRLQLVLFWAIGVRIP